MDKTKKTSDNVRCYVLYAVRREKVQAFIQSAWVVLLRTCMEVGQIFMDYVVNSLERPLGKVIKFWWRFEFQDTKGNLLHIHSLLWIDESDEEIIRNRIRCSVADLFREGELEKFIEMGILSSIGDGKKLGQRPGK